MSDLLVKLIRLLLSFSTFNPFLSSSSSLVVCYSSSWNNFRCIFVVSAKNSILGFLPKLYWHCNCLSSPRMLNYLPVTILWHEAFNETFPWWPTFKSDAFFSGSFTQWCKRSLRRTRRRSVAPTFPIDWICTQFPKTNEERREKKKTIFSKCRWDRNQAHFRTLCWFLLASLLLLPDFTFQHSKE